MSFPQYYKILGISETATSDQIRTAYKKESLKTHPDRLPPTSTPQTRRTATEKFQAVADAYYVLSDPVRRRDYDNLARSRGGFGSGSGAGAGGGFGGGGFGSGASAGAGGAGGPPGGFPEFDFSQFFPPPGQSQSNSKPKTKASSSRSSSSKAHRKPDPNVKTEDDDEDEQQAEEESQASSNYFRYFANMFGFGKKDEGDEAGMRGQGGRPDPNRVFGDVFEDMLAPEVSHVRPYYSYVGAASGAALGFIIGNLPGAAAGGVAGNRLGAIRDAKGKSVAEVFGGLGAGQKAEILRVLAMKVLGNIAS